MNCLVLGGAGFIGSHLCEGLLGAGHAVRVFARAGTDRRNVAHLERRVEWRQGDFLDRADIQDALAGIDVVFHLISTTRPEGSNENSAYDIATNLISTLHLLDACRDQSIRKLVFLSSGGTVYGVPRDIPMTEDHPTDPICSHGIHKLAIEKYLFLHHRLYGLDYTVLRLSNPYGERQDPYGRQGAVSVFLNRALSGEPIEIWGDGSVVRDYLHVSDVVQACLAALAVEGETRLFNIAGGRGLSLLQLVAAIERATGREVDVRFMPPRAMDVPVNVLSIERARSILGWAPRVGLPEGLERTIAHLVSQGTMSRLR